MIIKVDTFEDDRLVRLLSEHLADMRAISPPESVHALELSELEHPSISFWAFEKHDDIFGCIALKELDKSHGEIKSMRTSARLRKMGIASQLLTHVLNVAQKRHYQKLSLETGTAEFFNPARQLYKKFGFSYCKPFADYKLDLSSCFMTRTLDSK